MAEKATELKVAKYSDISATHEFLPVAFETLGPMNKAAVIFSWQRLSAVSGDAREGAFLFQRLSIAVQRFNCVALHDSFPASVADDY